MSSDSNSGGSTFTPGEVVAGRYRVERLIGRGGMGEVYLSRDLVLDEPVALKFLPPRLAEDTQALEMLHSEVRLARGVSHRNVARVHDIADVDGRQFLTMAYIEGQDLEQLLERHGPPELDRAYEWAVQICRGLEAAHEGKVLHRDIKPANVMIGADGEARIMDFGLAVASGAGSSSGAAGTLHYMAPELLRGQSTGIRTEVYALGLLLYELFTGRQAVSGESVPDIMEWHRSGKRVPLRELRPEIDAKTAQVVERCMEHEAGARPEAVRDVRVRLPGGDPLEAARERGETLHADVVAETYVPVTYRRKAALLGVGLAIAAICAILALAPSVLVTSAVAPTRSAEELQTRARTILADAGIEVGEGNGWGFFDYDEAQVAWLSDRFSDRLEAIRSSGTYDPSVLGYQYRVGHSELENPRLPRSRYLQYPWLTGDLAEGDLAVRLDARGTLTSILRVPSAEERRGTVGEADFGRLFAAANLSAGLAEEVPPGWRPDLPVDRRRAWKISGRDVRVEAGTQQGNLTYFRVGQPWQPAGEVSRRSRRARLGLIARIVNYVAVLIAVLFGLRNIRRGLADVRSALTVAASYFLLFLAWWFFDGVLTGRAATRMPDVSAVAGAGLWVGAVIGALLLGLEPYYRRKMPHMLVSWLRFLRSGLRDPLVGRDAFVGVICGTMLTAIFFGGISLGNLGGGDPLLLGDGGRFDWSTTLPYPVRSLDGTATAVAAFIGAIVNGLRQGMVASMMLVVVWFLLRRKALAFLALYALLVAVWTLPYDGALMRGLGFATLLVLLVAALYRFGLLAFVVAISTSYVLESQPLVLDPTHPLFPRTLLAVVPPLVALWFCHRAYAGASARAGAE